MYRRRTVLKGIAAVGLATGACRPVRASGPITPEAFGARGDGIAADGPALSAMIEEINSTPGDGPLVVRCARSYLCDGAPLRPHAPSWNRDKPGMTVGLPAITRSNVTIDAQGARFTVPASAPFRRVVRGGSADDRFFVMWQFLGDNIRFIGGVVDGNLAARPFARGPRPLGFGGGDFGFVLEGSSWLLDSVTVENWGTDCALVANAGRATNCNFVHARRNGLSVVAARAITADNPVIVEESRFIDNGRWPEGVYNNPAAGIDVEAGVSDHPATVVVRNNRFEGNYLKDLQLSKSAVDCIVTGNIFHGDLRLRPLQKGGHLIEGNEFLDDAQILVTPARRGTPAVTIRNNRQNGAERSAESLVQRTNSRAAGAETDQELVD